jgi:outer membrane protein, multidrug efflux system
MIRLANLGAGAAIAVLLAACATGSDLAQHAASPIRPAFEHGAFADASAQPAQDWWRGFGDPLLDQLVDQAMSSNRDLLAAEADLKRARALAKLAGTQGGPFGALSASAGRQRQGEIDVEEGFVALDAQVSWEADVFGRIRAGTRAAEADALSVAEARRGVMTALAAQVASTYADLRGAQARLAAAQTNLEAQRETFRLTEVMRSGGRATQLEVMRADAALQATAAALPRIETQIDADIAALDLLTAGLSPQAKAELRKPGTAPAPPERLASGSPDDLLRRRPDIRQAQARVQAAAARVRASRVDWWPRLTFVGAAGLFGGGVGDFSDDRAFSFTIGPRIDWPALDARRNALRLEAAQAGAEAEFLRYDQTVLTAIKDVETALSAFDAARRAEARSEVAAQSARQAAAVSRVRYREGVDAFFNVLDSERTLAQADDNLAVARTQRSLAYVALGQALGAGWTDAPIRTAQASR